MSRIPEQPLPQSREVFSGLVAEHQPALRRYCHKLCRDQTMAADASQETFLRLWRRILLGQDLEHPAAWLRKVASTCTSDLLRGRQRQGKALENLEHQANSPAKDRDQDPLVSAELMARYEASLLTLPDQQRRAFLLRHEGGMTLCKVAEAMQLGLPTVKTHFARACLKLQADMHPFAPEPRP